MRRVVVVIFFSCHYAIFASPCHAAAAATLALTLLRHYFDFAAMLLLTPPCCLYDATPLAAAVMPMLFAPLIILMILACFSPLWRYAYVSYYAAYAADAFAMPFSLPPARRFSPMPFHFATPLLIDCLSLPCRFLAFAMIRRYADTTYDTGNTRHIAATDVTLLPTAEWSRA